MALCLATCTWQLSLAQATSAEPSDRSNTSPAERTLIIRAAALIDGTSPTTPRNQEILIHGDRIAAVYPAGSKPAPPARTSSISATRQCCQD